MNDLLFDIILLAVFLVILVKSAIFAINSIEKVTKRSGIGQLAAGFVIVAVATSVPEISVALFSTHTHNVGITLGDIFGSNVTNIGLIAALFLFLSPIKKIQVKTTKSLFPLLITASLIPLILLLVQQGSKFIGIALLGLFAFFVYYMLKSSKMQNHEQREKGSVYKPLLLFFVGIAGVTLSAKMIVDSASSIAEFTGIKQSVIGATIIALGTSLPELTVDIVAIKRRLLDLAIGDIIGSCITNITLVLGLVLVLSPVEINFGILSTLISFAIGLPVVLFVLIRNGHIQKWQSMVLFAIYLIFLIMIYEIQTNIGGIT
ncbi:sodium:calcium antiporter [Candidatus Nitrosarchaeum limnium]|jgi:cation:H+ antiporter|uniref:Putative K+-dependent Na+/Ca+ exchanger n=1 Tax=Candidatus Nitrosarchaeum limnium BG20 TaxID=859192 RepID=S2EXB6_9ARCH|nr:sodium:calcium antiporter [Candidatus Nitrosarchaeum limnium]EPA06844.1 putative K+-dependent Na+/Ca+ exchanger [Candidatus Nitrosarchaeum limnium BG20]